MALTAEFARTTKQAHRKGYQDRERELAKAKGLSTQQAEALVQGIPEYLVAHFDRYAVHFIGEDARIVALSLDLPTDELDGQPHLAIDSRDWNAALAKLQEQDHQVCHTDVPA